jgi:hypothetical protein
MFSAFIEKGSAAGLDTSCADAIRRPAFASEFPSRFLLQ